ncbi:MAG: hypothetical protein PHU98_06375 [Mariniphaga sp.]|nr:hypothetical protein [Mariniphaga sp.]
MTAQETIKNTLLEAAGKFRELNFAYLYVKHTGTHVVDVTPQDEVDKNIEYQKWEADFTYEFDKMYFPECVLFITKNSLTKIGIPDFVINPKSKKDG